MLSHLFFGLGFLFFFHSDKAAKTKPEVELVRVWPQWRDEGSFKRISEYFTHRENPGKILLRRSKPAGLPIVAPGVMVVAVMSVQPPGRAQQGWDRP